MSTSVLRFLCDVLKKSNFIPKHLINFVSICRCNLYSIGLHYPLLLQRRLYDAQSLRRDKKTKTKETQILRQESHHAWHDKGPYLIKGHKRQAEV